jgi:hypothetical protein
VRIDVAPSDKIGGTAVRLLRWLNERNLRHARLLEVGDHGRSLCEVALRHRDRIVATEEPFSTAYERPDLNDDVFGAIEKAFRRGYHQGAQEAAALILTEGVAKSAVLRWIERLYLWRMKAHVTPTKRLKLELPPGAPVR